MAISEQYRKRLEAIGLAAVRREIAVGNVQYLPVGEGRAQAEEWVLEQDKKAEAEKQNAEKEKRAATDLEARRFNTIRFWTVVAAVAGAIAALASIAAVIVAVK